MEKSFLKILTLVLVIGLNWGGISAVGYTLGMFNDTEDASGNAFTAGSLDFVLDASEFDPIAPSISLEPGDITWKDIDIIPETESNPFKYYTESSNFSGDEDFCDALDVDAKVLDSQMYSGVLRDLLTDATTTLPSWNFEFGMDQNNLQNKICNFDIVYNGWQTRHEYPTYENGGFSDTEKVSNTISSWGFRLNKVYYDIATTERGEEGDNEWVEIFNQTSVPLDISGWEICDNSSCDIIPTVDPIPAMGYGVITATNTTWGYWFVPNEVVKIVLDDGRIGDGLGDDGDALYLKRPDGIVVDEMNWQGNTDVWNPGAVDVVEGNLLARVPNGYDTDQASDWGELAPPDVDLIYPDEDETYAWYWTQNYEIQWTATNPNGDDADLAIDLYYVKDVNGDNEISEGDTRHEIVIGTANDGSQWWEVPKGFIGYIWIELIATGPENPMLNSKTVSGDIWDPIPIFLWEEDPQAIIDALTDLDGDEGVVIEEGEVMFTTTEFIETEESNEDETTETTEEDDDTTQENTDDASDTIVEEEDDSTEDNQSVISSTPTSGGSGGETTQESSTEEQATEEVSCTVDTIEGEENTNEASEEVNSCVINTENDEVLEIVEEEGDTDDTPIESEDENTEEVDIEEDVVDNSSATEENVEIDSTDEEDKNEVVDDSADENEETTTDENTNTDDTETTEVENDEVVSTEDDAEDISEESSQADEPEDVEIIDTPLVLEPIIEPEPQPEVEEEIVEDNTQDVVSENSEEDVPVVDTPEEPVITADNEDTRTEE